MRTQVGIVGAGPAGLVLARLLELRGISSVVIEARSRDYVEQRVRAGVLEQRSVDCLTEAGVADRLHEEGMVHHGIELRFGGQGHRIDFTQLTNGKSITVYGQQEVVKDLIAARLASELPLLFEVSDVAVDVDRPEVSFTHEGSAVELEWSRLRRLKRNPWSIRNDLLNAWLMSVVLFGGLIAVFGLEVAPWLAFQAIFGFTLLEIVNYLEHYGLTRQKKDDGRYERCRPEHSWNSNNVASNVFLYHLQRHSDHHANPTRRYQALRHFDEAPELPSGYATMILLALVPPLWRRVMDPKLVAHYGGDLRRANVHPRKRAKYGL